MLNLVLTSLHSSGSIRGGITLAWNVSTIASRTVGMNFVIVFSVTRKLYTNSLNVAPVAMCLSLIPSFSPGSNGCLKINKSKKLLIIDMCFLRQGLSKPDFYGDLVYKLKKIVGSNNFSAQFIKTISHYKKIGYDINV